jgi:hypothetical protein
LAIVDLHQNRNDQALLLFLWVAGVFVFTGFVNWSVNVRTVLPMAPAVAILAVRRIEKRQAISSNRYYQRFAYSILLLAALLSLAVTWADYTLAKSQRSTARHIDAEYKKTTATIWFQGHWGFQYYMEQLGNQPFDFENQKLQAGDIVIAPINNSHGRLLSQQTARIKQVLKKKTCPWLTTMLIKRGAGFYADVWGPLPYVFGPVPAETYLLYEIK